MLNLRNLLKTSWEFFCTKLEIFLTKKEYIATYKYSQ